MKKIGLCSETFEEKPNNAMKVKQVVRLVTMMLMTGNLQGCNGDSMRWTRSMASTWMNPMTWTSTTWWTLTTIALVSLVSYLVNEINKLEMQMAKYKAAWDSIRNIMDLRERQDPLAQDDGAVARRSSFSGIWLNEMSEEEAVDDDSIVDSADARESADRLMQVMDAADREEPPQPPRIFLSNGTHGASPGEFGGFGGKHLEVAERAERGEPDGGAIPTTEEGIEVLTEAIAEIADGTAGHGGHALHGGEGESDDETWIEKY